MRKFRAGWCVRDHTNACNFVLAGTSWKIGKCFITEGKAITLLEAIILIEIILIRFENLN
jgi:hypothetical protein